MKTLLTLVFLITLVLNAVAQDKFTEVMKKNIGMLYAAKDAAALQEAVNAFDRIGNAEKTKWEPFYYSAFGNIDLASREKEATRKDAFLDLAEAAINKAIALKKDDSEITAMDGFVTMVRISIEPETRGQAYSATAMQKLGKAVALDPNNPRALVLQAQMQMGMAAFFGQQPTEACANIRKSTELFAAAAPTSPIAPMWGKQMAEGLLKKCN